MARWCRGAPPRRAVLAYCTGGARPDEDPHGRGRLLAHRAGEVRSRWCGWGSWDGSGRAVVQICCKGALRPDRSGAEPRNINDSSRASRPDGGLCNRFGQTAPPRARGNVRQGASRPGRRPRRALRRANGARGPRRRPPRAPPDAETCTSHSKVQFQPSFSSAKRASRGRNAHLDEHSPPPTISDGPRPHRPAPVPVRGPRLSARKAHCAPLVPRERGARPRARPAHPGRRSRPEGARGGGSKPRASHLFRRRTSHHRSARARGSRKRRRSAQRGGE